jgi:DNA-binding NtrC family response regulator
MTRLTTETDLSSDEGSGSTAPPPHPALILAQAPRGLRKPVIRLLPSFPVELGRESPSLLGIEDSKISRHHARIEQREGRWWLVDLGSRNGTWLQGQRVSGAVPLRLGEVIRVGDTLLVFMACSPRGFFEDGLVSVSAPMVAIRETIARVARDDASVLISGETGTGKEVVAQLLHGEGERRGQLVTVNCGALTESLLASELFGHVKGAFTGASDAREGLFRQAEGGTLFLDEIGEMPPPMQVRLLRVLETRVVRPVGGARDVPVNVRVVAATNRDLPTALREGTFRPDLYARLAQRQIVLPPLRERRADIPFLIHRLLGRRSAFERPLSLALMHRLLLHPWPFNVRGLLNVLLLADQVCPPGTPLSLTPEIEQVLRTEASLVAPGDPPAPPPQDLPVLAPTLSPAATPPAVPPALAPLSSGAPPRILLEAMLQEHKGHVSDVARRLGCKRQQLYAWFSYYQLSPESFR